MRQLNHSISHWPLAKAFVISRGARTQADVVQVMIDQEGTQGFGECVPYARYGESLGSVCAQIDSVADQIRDGADRRSLLSLLPAGAARNAIDCALWDLEARLTSTSVAEISGMGKPAAMISAQTISIGSPSEMAQEAKEFQNYPVLKAKMAEDLTLERLSAIHEAAPNCKLIIDANEAWNINQLNSFADQLKSLGVILVEQPLPADQDHALTDYQGDVPVCADESCHTSADIAQLANRYQAVNIKLDKTGGLTEAIEVMQQARHHNLLVMVGCMVGTSLAMAPATIIAQHADFIDLDGPALLAEDVAHGFHYKTGEMSALSNQLWGN